MRKTAGTSTASVSNAQGTGELWIRIDDSQIVGQLVKVSVDFDALSGVDVSAAAANMGKASMEMSLDTHFSHDGEASRRSRLLRSDHDRAGVQTGSNAVSASCVGGGKALSGA